MAHRNPTAVRLLGVRMRRVAPVIALLVLVLASSARAADKPALAAALLTCTSGPAPADRAASFTAAMPALDPLGRMQLRFVLLQRRGVRGAYRPVSVPGWGSWEKAAPGRLGLVFTKRVAGLLAPAGYRARVVFRWYAADGSVQREAVRTTPACEQPDPRPDLAFAALTAIDQGVDAAYVVEVVNDGRGTAPASTVTLTIGGAVLGPVEVGPLAPGARADVSLVGVRCAPGSAVLVTLDAGATVDEANERDDRVARPCPL